MFLTRAVLFVNRFSKFLLQILRQTKCSNCAKNIFHLDLISCKISEKKQYQTRDKQCNKGIILKGDVKHDPVHHHGQVRENKTNLSLHCTNIMTKTCPCNI